MKNAMATIRDVAREAAVSVASASRALNGHSHVTPAMRDRVVAAAAKLAYVPHLGARSLTMSRTNTIGVLLPDVFGEFFSEIIRGIDRASHAQGLQLLLSHLHGNVGEIDLAIRAMRGRVDGLMVMSRSIGPALLAAHLPTGLPSVILGERVNGVGHASLSIDNAGGAAAMVAHLAACGCRRIAMIAGPVGNADADERLAGFRDAVARHLGDGDPPAFAGDFTEAAGRAVGERIAANRAGIDAVFAANDLMAVGCLTALLDAGVDVPGDIAVAGFDDLPIARYVQPGLTTMRVDFAELGTRAFETLSDLLVDPGVQGRHGQVLTPELVMRRSTRR